MVMCFNTCGAFLSGKTLNSNLRIATFRVKEQN